MKKFLVAGFLALSLASASFAGGSWVGNVVPSSVAVENTMDNGAVLLVNLAGVQYVMPLDMKASGAILERQNFMIRMAQTAVESSRPFYVWYSSTSNTVTWKDLTGSTYTNIKIDGTSFH